MTVPGGGRKDEQVQRHSKGDDDRTCCRMCTHQRAQRAEANAWAPAFMQARVPRQHTCLSGVLHKDGRAGRSHHGVAHLCRRGMHALGQPREDKAQTLSIKPSETHPKTSRGSDRQILGAWPVRCAQSCKCAPGPTMSPCESCSTRPCLTSGPMAALDAATAQPTKATGRRIMCECTP